METAEQHKHITVYDIAMACHEANRSLQFALGEDPAAKWGNISQDMRASAVDGVRASLSGVSTPEGLHQNWMDFKTAQGWIYGPDKSEKKKTHPCLVPYEDLPEEQRAKDHLFSSVVSALKPLLINAEEFAS